MMSILFNFCNFSYFWYTEDVDFRDVSQTITFNTGDTIMCVNVTILGDDIIEGEERFPLSLVPLSSNVDISQSSAIVTINDDDDVEGKYGDDDDYGMKMFLH